MNNYEAFLNFLTTNDMTFKGHKLNNPQYWLTTTTGITPEYPGDPKASRRIACFETWKEANEAATEYYLETGETSVWVEQA